MEISTRELILPGAELGLDNPLPFLRDKSFDRELIDGGLNKNELEGFAYMTGRRVLPYTMQDGYTRDKRQMKIKCIVLENEYLRAVFLPEYGGRLYSLFDKEASRELLSVNPVFQPCNLAVRNAWFSGGIEWNLGQYGHSGLSCAPMFFAKVENDGYAFLRMYEYERIKDFFLQIDFHLPKDSRVLLAHVTIYNTRSCPSSLYWWTNIAVPLKKNMRVLSGTQHVISCMPNGGKFDTFKHEELPSLEGLPGMDATFPGTYPYSTEFFYQNEHTYEQAWEAAAYDDGSVFFERSTPQMPYRKLFCWSSRRGGERWQEFLSREGETPYLEIQSGLYPTQVHGGDAEGGAVIRFTQAFGGLDADKAMTHAADYAKACEGLYGLIDDRMPKDELALAHERFSELSKLPCGGMLSYGSGWGALEARLDSVVVPSGLSFDDDTLGEKQADWLELINNGRMPGWNGMPPASYQCGTRWLELMRPLAGRSDANKEILFHYGIACYENGLFDQAKEAFERAYSISRQPVICYALAMLSGKSGDMDRAVLYSREMIACGALKQSRAFAKEHAQLLINACLFDEAWSFYTNLDADLREWEALRRAIMPAAYEMGENDFLDKQFYSEFATIREGERDIVSLWFNVRAKEYMSKEGTTFDEAMAYVKTHMPPPYEIDFQTYG